MILKALFVGSTLNPIVGLDARANPELARILLDYADERRAAERPITPELWRCVGPFADERAMQDMKAAFDAGGFGAKGVALALTNSTASGAAGIIAGSPQAAFIADGSLTWASLTAEMAEVEMTPALPNQEAVR